MSNSHDLFSNINITDIYVEIRLGKEFFLSCRLYNTKRVFSTNIHL